jgi:hypothetical protein
MRRASLFGLTTATVVSLCVGAQGLAATRVNGLTINVTYAAKSLQAKLSNGNVLANGSVVPPGPYSVVVYDGGDDPSPQFAMTGPGVAVASDLNPNGTGVEVPMIFGPFVLEPSASYTIYDAGIGGASIGFTTSATGSSASPDAPAPTQSPAPAAKQVGALALAVTAAGKAIFTSGGKPVKTVAAGSYSVVVGDLSKRAGLFLGHGNARPSVLSGIAAVGTSLHTLRLTRGMWFTETSMNGPKTYFKVV